MATQDELLKRHRHELRELVFELNQANEYKAAAAAQNLLIGIDELEDLFAELGIGADEFESPC